MASIYDLKPQFQSFLRPLVGQLAARGWSANHVTVLACGMSLALGLLLTCQADKEALFFIFPVFLFVRMALNAIDGMLAREHGMKSELGGILNELTDVIADTFLYLPFAFVPWINSWSIVTILWLSMLSEMAGVVAVTIGAQRRYDGPMGKSDRAFAFSLLALTVALGLQPATLVALFLYALQLLLVVTIWNRCRQALLQKQVNL